MSFIPTHFLLAPQFGYITPGLPVKYPMHYVPEVLMAGMTVAGVMSLM